MSVPAGVLTNADFEKMVDTSDEWITTRTGIKERRKLAEDELLSDISAEASVRALEHAGVRAEELDLIICCTFSPDVAVPCMACVIQDKLGIGGRTAAFDLNAACTGFVYGVSVAASMMRTGPYQKVLVVGADAVTRCVDYKDRGTSILFGDGAGAVVMGETGPGRGLLGDHLGADGSQADALIIYGNGTKKMTPEEAAQGKYNIYMDGREVFKFATRVMGEAAEASIRISENGMTMNEVDWIFPHQANIRILEAAAKRLKFPMEKVVVNLDRYGNTSAASVPMAMAEAAADGRLKRGDTIILVAFGGGLTYGASLWIW